MCSYNMVNNSYACGNSKLLNGLLRDEMGFQGFVMSDWLAQRGGVSSALAGLDMTMPGDGLFWANGQSLWGPELTKSVLNGSVPLDRLNDMVTRIVAAWYQMGQDDEKKFDRNGPNFSSWTDQENGVFAPGSPTKQEEHKVNEFVNVMGHHSTLARQIAAEGTVLLKNEGLLPITRDGSTPNNVAKTQGSPLRIAIFGEDAGPGEGPNYCKDRACNQGTLASGWGSGAVEFPYLISPDQALQKAWDSKRVKVTTHLTNTHAFEKQPGILEEADICIVFAHSDSGEAYTSWGSVKGDRPDLFLQKGGDDLIVKVAEGCPQVLVVIHTVGPVVMERWIDLPNVKAVSNFRINILPVLGTFRTENVCFGPNPCHNGQETGTLEDIHKFIRWLFESLLDEIDNHFLTLSPVYGKQGLWKLPTILKAFGSRSNRKITNPLC